MTETTTLLVARRGEVTKQMPVLVDTPWTRSRLQALIRGTPPGPRLHSRHG